MLPEENSERESDNPETAQCAFQDILGVMEATGANRNKESASCDLMARDN